MRRVDLLERKTAAAACLGAALMGAVLGAAAMLVSRDPRASINQEGPAPRPAMMVPVTLAGVIDDRARFREIFCALDAAHGSQFTVRRACRDALQQLDGEKGPTMRALPAVPSDPGSRMHLVIIPGMFGDCVSGAAMPLQDAAAYMRREGYRVDTINVEGRSSSRRNAGIIARALARSRRAGERLLVLGYSKGTSDILETLALYPQAIGPGSVVVSLAGIVSGTPLAKHPAALTRVISHIPLSRCAVGDAGAVASVSRQHRMAWLADHALPNDRTYYSLAAFTDDAHVSSPLKETHAELSKTDARNDGQVLYTDAILPHSHLLGYLNADHWAIALPFARNVPALRRVFDGRNDYPREIMLEAIVRTVEEQTRGQPSNRAG